MLSDLKLIWLKVDQWMQSLTSLESILASSLALRIRLTIHLSASSGVMLSLSASMLSGESRVGGGISVKKISFGGIQSLQSSISAAKYTWKTAGTWVTSNLWEQRAKTTTEHRSSGYRSYIDLFHSCPHVAKRFSWIKRQLHTLLLANETISRTTHLMLMHWWILQKVSKMKSRAFSIKSSRQATKKKSFTRTWRKTDHTTVSITYFNTKDLRTENLR